jgi:threonine/homoserine/homoserine lactone efflux protein
MTKYLRILGLGCFISFLGSLPLGSLNVAAMQVYVAEGFLNALQFSVGVMLVEVAYVRVSLVAMAWILRHKMLFRIMEWITVLLFIGLAIGSFLAASDTNADQTLLLNNNINRFLLGVFLCAINPAQIPFWFLWSTTLMSSKKLEPVPIQFNLYCIGIGMGTLLGEGVYMFGGKWLIERFNAGQGHVNFFVGVVFVITALIQLYRVLFKKSKLEDEKLLKEVHE